MMEASVRKSSRNFSEEPGYSEENKQVNHVYSTLAEDKSEWKPTLLVHTIQYIHKDTGCPVGVVGYRWHAHTEVSKPTHVYIEKHTTHVTVYTHMYM